MIESGDIWLIDFDPTVGSEQAGRRPALVVSGNAMNSHFTISMVCPLTTMIKNMAGSVILKPNKTNKLKMTSEVLGIHLKSISHKRFIKKIGSVENDEKMAVISNINKLFKY